jgi:hypothetical protein
VYGSEEAMGGSPTSTNVFSPIFLTHFSDVIFFGQRIRLKLSSENKGPEMTMDMIKVRKMESEK